MINILGVSAINAWEEIMNGFDFTRLVDLLMSVIPALICITLHELSHGVVACLLGDDTAKRAGRLTLNPIKHLDPMGLAMMAMFHVGWAKPVPINMYRFKNPKRGMALTALAGPVSNFVIAVVFLFLYGCLYLPLQGSSAGWYVEEMLRLTAVISIGLGVFNLIPLPPLDGSKVLFSVLSDEGYYKLMRYERYGSIIMFALVSLGVLGGPLSAAIRAVTGALTPVAQLGMNLVMRLFYS